MPHPINPYHPNRRRFLKQLSTAGMGLTLASSRGFAQGANERVNLAMVGVNSRGNALAEAFAHLKDAHIGYVCDVDSRAMVRTTKKVAGIQKRQPAAQADFRRMLEDPAVDAVVIATPDHWHAPAAILAMNAGKHVYVEKPGSHNPAESYLVVEASRKHGRKCQMGNQRRSWSRVKEAVELMKNGGIGNIRYVRTWYANNRKPIGRGKAVPVPEWLDWDLWQGPAPRKEYKDNIVHYNWHWFWNWCTGESGNNAIHPLDLARWVVGDDYPTKVVAAGGRYYAEDDWQPPDTQMMSFEFPSKVLVTWEGMSCNRMGNFGEGVGVLFEGDKGSLRIHAGNGYTIYDEAGKQVRTGTGDDKQEEISQVGPGLRADMAHARNFLDAIKGNAELASDISEGQKSTMLIHLANISHKTGRAIHCDPKTGKIIGDEEAVKEHWQREYQPGWKPEIA